MLLLKPPTLAEEKAWVAGIEKNKLQDKIWEWSGYE